MAAGSFKPHIPIFLEGIENPDNLEKLILAGDVGGTKTNLAIYKVEQDGVKLQHESSVVSASYHSVIDIINEFCGQAECRPDRISMGVAGPVINGVVELTNLSWDINVREIIAKTDIGDIRLLNDLEATAYGMAGLKRGDFISVVQGNENSSGNMAIIAPGTGLGEAGLYWDGSAYHPFPTEGGHCDFSPRTDFDKDLHSYLDKKYGVISWEHLIAGPGIFDLYKFYRDGLSREEPEWLAAEIENGDPSAVISEAAMEEKAAICMETMETFVRYLARESSNLILKMKATGGLLISGGISPKIKQLILTDNFHANFLDCDRMQHLLREVPVKIVLNEKAPMIGAAIFGAYGKRQVYDN